MNSWLPTLSLPHPRHSECLEVESGILCLHSVSLFLCVCVGGTWGAAGGCASQANSCLSLHLENKILKEKHRWFRYLSPNKIF